MVSFVAKIVILISVVIVVFDETFFRAASFTSVPRMNNVSFPFPAAVPVMVSARITSVSRVIILLLLFDILCLHVVCFNLYVCAIYGQSVMQIRL